VVKTILTIILITTLAGCKESPKQVNQQVANALIIAEQNKAKTSFCHEFNQPSEDSSEEIKTALTFGNLFEEKNKHLIIRIVTPAEISVTIYALEKNNFKLITERTEWTLDYINDTIRDINGDSFNDYIVHTYPSSGCCLADVYHVYLYQQQSGDFTSSYKFLNPTLYPAEKTIRGLTYGHPGEAGLYKFKWNGTQIDTIEYLYPLDPDKKTFLKTNKPNIYPKEDQGKIIHSFPTEYLSLDSVTLNWFMGTY
jgi:hypothetical protein